MKPLLLLELRRQLPVVMKMAALTVLMAVLFYALGKRSPAEFLAVLLGSSLGVMMIVPAGILRDKMEGSLDFICGLPVEARAIAASRFIAVAVLSLPWAFASGVASHWLPPSLAMNPVGVGASSWLVMILFGMCGTAMLVRYDIGTLIAYPMFLMIVSPTLAPRVAHALFPELTKEAMLTFLQQPLTPVLVALALLGAVVSAGHVAFRIAERGFAEYRYTGMTR